MNPMIVLSEFERKMDKDMLKHCFQMSRLAKIYEKRKGLQDKMLSNTAPLCDIGKIYLSGKIRNKGFEEELTNVERGIVDLYPFISYEILKEMGVEEEISTLVLYHHGDNPSHTAGASLPVLTPDIAKKAKILHAICDFTALIEDRPYRDAYDKAGALKEMKKSVIQYDKEILEFIEYEEFTL